MSEKRKRYGMSWDDANPTLAGSRRYDEQLDIYKFDLEWATIRLIGEVWEIRQHWLPVTKKDGSETRFPRLCLKTGDINNPCPYCNAGIKANIVYMSNAIIRDIQENKPENKSKLGVIPEDQEYRKKGDKWWSPVRVVQFPATIADRIKGYKKLNKTEDGNSYPLNHPKFGVDLQISRNLNESGSGMYDIQLGGSFSPLNKEERGLLMYDIDSVFDCVETFEDAVQTIMGVYDRGMFNEKNCSMDGVARVVSMVGNGVTINSKPKNKPSDDDDSDDDIPEVKDSFDDDEDEEETPKKKNKSSKVRPSEDVEDDDYLTDDDEEDEKPKKKGKKSVDDDEDEEETPKKKKAKKPVENDDDDLDEDNDDPDEDEEPKKKKAKKPVDDDDDDFEEAPKKKGKKPVNDDDFDDEDEEPKKKKAKKPVDDDDEDEKPKKKKSRIEDEDEERLFDDEEETPKKKKAKKPVDDDEDEEETPKKKGKKPIDDDDDFDNEDEDEDEEDEKPKKKKAKKPVEDDDDPDSDDDEDEKPKKSSKKSSKKKHDDDLDFDDD